MMQTSGYDPAMNIRTEACFALSRMFMRSPVERTVDYSAYDAWRDQSLSHSWSAFSDDNLAGKDVLDFGCGDGQLSVLLAKRNHAGRQGPRSIVGVDIDLPGLERARVNAHRAGVAAQFLAGSVEGMPIEDQSIDTLIAFDCMEHVMAPEAILRDWYRVLRPAGRCLIEWFPYKGPWGPHMEALIPLPWAHVLFGQRAMFRAAERIYDHPAFTPRHWDLDEQGRKKPNKWRAWSSFREQGYINELSVPAFCKLARSTGFEVARLERRSFGGSPARRAVGVALKGLPLIGDYFVSSVIVELRRP